MNHKVSIFKLQIEKWASVIHRGLLAISYQSNEMPPSSLTPRRFCVFRLTEQTYLRKCPRHTQPHEQ